ncbi:MAG TPA: hypothetical protein VFH43_08560, partial [Candidatus Kapabacteria bacterium]|nr:hypothetical protein [Candidatus Kapabacteria bacterium]
MYKKLLLAMLLVLGFAATASAQEVLQDSITGTKTLTNDRTWLIRGFVYVVDGAVLNIEPGTVIFGEKTSKGTLIVERGGKIFARGEADKPIVFTSQQAPGQRAHGDWGGIVICGRAPMNLAAGEAQIEGGPRSRYGGNLPADNSGVLKYVRIEFPGIALSPNNELNGLTFGAVGSGTEVDHVQVSYSGDDSYEWFGGNVSAKYLIAHRCVDDDWDTDFGWSGNLQFGVSLRDPQVADISGSNGIESDNNNVPNWANPRTSPAFSNMTIIGPLRDTSDAVNPLFRVGAHLRRNTLQSIYNSVIMGWPTGGILLDNVGVRAAADNDTLQVRNTVVAGVKLPYIRTASITGFDALGWFNRPGYKNGHTNVINQLEMIDPFNLTKPSFVTFPTSPLTQGGNFDAARLQSSFFTKTNYIGAFSSSSDWTQGWANFDPQNTSYAGTATATVTSVVFASTAVGSTRDSLVAIICNTGGAPLAISQVSVTGDRFTIQNGQASYNVLPNSTQSLTIRFSPTDTALANGTLSFMAKGQTYSIALSGRGLLSEPKIVIETGSKLDFALVRVNESVQD